MVICSLSGRAPRADRYQPEDWISYDVFRHVTSIAMDDQYVYFGTTGGVMRYDHWRDEWAPPLTTSSGLLDNYVLDVAIDETFNEIVFHTRRGVCRYDPILESWRIGGTFPPSTTDRNYQYPELFPDFGLNYYRQEEGAYLTDPYLRSYSLTAHLSDMWGNLWIGTSGLGAGKASLRSGRLRMLNYGLREENVAAIAFDGDRIWLGGVNMWDGSTSITRVDRQLQDWEYFESRYVNGLDSDDVTAFAVDEEKVWVGTLYGLSRFDKETEDWLTLTTWSGLTDDWITDVVLDGKTLWVGTSMGASRVDTRGDSVLMTEVPIVGRQKVYDIEVDDDFVWFGTHDGVRALDKNTNTWLKFTSPDGTLERVVTAISSFEDEIWFGTTIGVTVYQVSQNRWRWYSAHQHLQAGHIVCLEAGEKAVWAGTETGLWKLRRQTDRWRSFTTEDGLLDNMVQTILLDGSYIWIGTAAGVTRFFWDNPMRID